MFPHSSDRRTAEDPISQQARHRPGLELSHFLREAEISALYRPTAEATGLPGRAYDSEFYRFEQHSLFPRSWCAVAFASDLPDPGDAVPVMLAGWPLMVVRGEDETLRAFHNVCRHRAMRVLEKPCKGRTTLSCPWHRWTYDLAGKLVATPRIGGEHQNTDPGFAPAADGLKPVRLGQYLDLIFVNIDGAAPPFHEHIAPLRKLLAEFDLSDLRLGARFSLRYPGNWKVSVEGALEEYHIPFGHPQHVRNVCGDRPGVVHAGRTYMGTFNARRYHDRLDAAASAGLNEAIPPLPRRQSSDGERAYSLNIFPTCHMDLRGNRVNLGLFLPDGPERTDIVLGMYYRGAAATEPAHAALRSRAAAEMRQVFEQDIEFARHVHENAKVRDAAGIDTCFVPFWEGSVQRFQQAVVEVLRGDR